jgi:hypothetical protein
MSQMRLVRYPDRSGHAAAAVVEELEEVVLASGEVKVSNGWSPLPFVAGRLMWGLFRRGWWSGGGAARRGSREYFAVLMGHRFRNCLPFFAFGARNYIYLFDAWPSAHQEILSFVSQFGVEHLFVSASQAAERLAGLGLGTRVHWVPEGVTPAEHPFRPYAMKDIDIVQYGRKWDSYHEKILEPLAANRRTYLYEKVKGQIIFPTRDAFLDALARTRISICFPSSVTHPERAGDICTMTHRYLESMAAKCLVVGIQPPEMDGLFDHTAVVPADPADPAGQLLDILAHFDDYIDLIESNYRAVCERHSWEVRWQQMAQIISPAGDAHAQP